MRSIIKYCFILSLMFSSCGDDEVQKPNYTKEELKKILEESNEVRLKKEEEDIQNYVNRRGWKTEKTGSGVYYYVYKHGDGAYAETGKGVVANYSIELLNGKKVFATKIDNPMVFVVSESDLETGMHEALPNLREGDKAMVIIPSHSAHGLLGDNEKIPPLATVIYDIEILKVQ